MMEGGKKEDFHPQGFSWRPSHEIAYSPLGKELRTALCGSSSLKSKERGGGKCTVHVEEGISIKRIVDFRGNLSATLAGRYAFLKKLHDLSEDSWRPLFSRKAAQAPQSTLQFHQNARSPCGGQGTRRVTRM